MRIDRKLKVAAEKAAAEDNRSLAGLIVKLLHNYLDRHGRKWKWQPGFGQHGMNGHTAVNIPIGIGIAVARFSTSSSIDCRIMQRRKKSRRW
jgi:hypothetical protein